jgi:hypothetical protein
MDCLRSDPDQCSSCDVLGDSVIPVRNWRHLRLAGPAARQIITPLDRTGNNLWSEHRDLWQHLDSDSDTLVELPARSISDGRPFPMNLAGAQPVSYSKRWSILHTVFESDGRLLSITFASLNCSV